MTYDGNHPLVTEALRHFNEASDAYLYLDTLKFVKTTENTGYLEGLKKSIWSAQEGLQSCLQGVEVAGDIPPESKPQYVESIARLVDVVEIWHRKINRS